jgi:hypothetical protein
VRWIDYESGPALLRLPDAAGKPHASSGIAADHPTNARKNLTIMASSPFIRRGELWRMFDKHYGAKGGSDYLVARGTTREFNPLVPQDEIDRELERDPETNRAEYLAEFRSCWRLKTCSGPIQPRSISYAASPSVEH